MKFTITITHATSSAGSTPAPGTQAGVAQPEEAAS